MHVYLGTSEERLGRIRAWALFLLLAATAIALTGCAESDDAPEASETPEATAPPLESPTLELPTPEPTPEPTQSSTVQAPGLPTDADAYAQATFEAWTRGDTATLDELVADAAFATLESRIPPEPGTWAPAGCDAATGQLSCAYQGPAGETLMLLVDLAVASAAQPHAVVVAEFA